jgi:acetyl-CoA synthase
MTDNTFPLPYGQEYEGERIRPENLQLEYGGANSRMVEWLTTADIEDIEDGVIEVIGPDIGDVPEKSVLPLAIIVKVAGSKMQPDYEAVLEKQIHRI